MANTPMYTLHMIHTCAHPYKFTSFPVINIDTYWHIQIYYYPIGSMYGIYANIWGILMVNVTIYTIHGSYGYVIYVYIIKLLLLLCIYYIYIYKCVCVSSNSVSPYKVISLTFAVANCEKGSLTKRWKVLKSTTPPPGDSRTKPWSNGGEMCGYPPDPSSNQPWQLNMP